MGNFDDAVQWLAQDRQPAFSPLLLRFDTPASLLRLRRTVRDDESNTSSPLPLLLGLTAGLVAPKPVRARLVELLPDVETLKEALIGSTRSSSSKADISDEPKPAKRPRLGDEKPFITEEIYEMVRLEEMKALYATNKHVVSGKRVLYATTFDKSLIVLVSTSMHSVSIYCLTGSGRTLILDMVQSFGLEKVPIRLTWRYTLSLMGCLGR